MSTVTQDTLDEVKRLSISGLRHELILGAMIRAELVGIRMAIKEQTAVMIKLAGVDTTAPQQKEEA